MQNQWIQQEWDDVRTRLQQCTAASDSKTLRQQADAFATQDPPTSYAEVLERVRDAAKLAIACGTQSSPTLSKRPKFDPDHGIVDAIDEAGMESFPASDSPAY